MDEMSIKEQIIYDKKQFHSSVNYGTVQNIEDDNDNPTSKNALVLMEWH